MRSSASGAGGVDEVLAPERKWAALAYSVVKESPTDRSGMSPDDDAMMPENGSRTSLEATCRATKVKKSAPRCQRVGMATSFGDSSSKRRRTADGESCRRWNHWPAAHGARESSFQAIPFVWSLKTCAFLPMEGACRPFCAFFFIFRCLCFRLVLRFKKNTGGKRDFVRFSLIFNCFRCCLILI